MEEIALTKTDENDVICRSKAMLKVIREMALEHREKSRLGSISENVVSPPVQDHTCLK